MLVYAIIIAYAIIAVIAGLIRLASAGALISYCIGLAMGIALSVIAIRGLGKRAKTSHFASALFYRITRYKASIYYIHNQQAPTKEAKAVVYESAHEYADLLDILKGQMRFPAAKAQDATKFVMESAKDKPFEEKIRVALQYMGDEQNSTA